MKYIKLFNTHTEYQAFTQTNDFIKPNVSYCIDNNDVHYNPWTWAEEYLTFVALGNGTFTFTPKNNNVISYSIDNGKNWTEGNSVEVANGDKVIWKGTMTPVSNGGIGGFSSTGNFEVKGNVMSLLFGDDFKGKTDLTGKNYAFSQLFYYAGIYLVSAKDLSLPATILAYGCYISMFNGCTSLTTAPELPATTLASYCYSNMFYGCTSLTTAPELPATTLATYCYNGMFRGCTNLTSAPELPATTLASNCYYYMFNGCTNLNYIKAMFTTTPSTSYTSNWVNGVSSTGTFVKNSAATWDVTGEYGIPTGWTVETASA